MKRWRKVTWHGIHIEDEDGELIGSARTARQADDLVAQHNALIEFAEAMAEVLRISDRKHDAWDRAKAALAKLERDK